MIEHAIIAVLIGWVISSILLQNYKQKFYIQIAVEEERERIKKLLTIAVKNNDKIYLEKVMLFGDTIRFPPGNYTFMPFNGNALEVYGMGVRLEGE